MCDGFPLLTTKKMAFKTMCIELEGFIKAITDKKWYQDRRCKIWDEWGNPEVVKNHPYMRDFQYDETMTTEDMNTEWNSRKKAAQKETNDLGPIYGRQWRAFDEHYGEMNGWKDDMDYANGVYEGTDQLKNIVDALRNNPMDRRMVCSAWNPNQIGMMALPPCHYSWNVTVIGNELNLFWAQRSCDLMLGVPFNIASYALLLCLLAEVGGFKRGNLSGMLVDCHIYENQIEAARKQIERDPRPLPGLRIRTQSPVEAIKDHVAGKPKKQFDIFQWEYKDVELIGYNPHDKLDFGDVVV
jgi:thymidylate synthase